MQQVAERTLEEQEARPSYLKFVQHAVARMLVLEAEAYLRVRQAGRRPAPPGVDHVELTIKTVVGPVYNKFYPVLLDQKFPHCKVRTIKNLNLIFLKLHLRI